MRTTSYRNLRELHGPGGSPRLYGQRTHARARARRNSFDGDSVYHGASIVYRCSRQQTKDNNVICILYMLAREDSGGVNASWHSALDIRLPWVSSRLGGLFCNAAAWFIYSYKLPWHTLCFTKLDLGGIVFIGLPFACKTPGKVAGCFITQGAMEADHL